MAQPKTLRILEAVADRLAVVSQAAGYFSEIGCDVRLDQREPNIEDLPCARVYLSEGVIDERQNDRQAVTQSVNVIAFDRVDTREAEAVGWQLVADIQKAIELDDNTIGGLLASAREGLAVQSFEVSLPETGANAVAARVTYAVSHIRKSGDPEIL